MQDLPLYFERFFS